MDELDKQIKQIKLARMKPEEKVVYDVINTIDQVDFRGSNCILYLSNGFVIFQYIITSKSFHSNNREIHRTLRSKYDITFSSRLKIINTVCKRYLKTTISNG